MTNEPICECEEIDVLESGPPLVMRRPDCPVHGEMPTRRVEAAANAISESSGMRFDGFWMRVDELEPEDRAYALSEARAALEAADAVSDGRERYAEIWDAAYRQGVEDERTSRSNPGIAGCFCTTPSDCRCFIQPARVNPYRKGTGS